jgi:hypothetical protein
LLAPREDIGHPQQTRDHNKRATIKMIVVGLLSV